MDLEVRAEVCQCLAPVPAQTRRQVAFGRGGADLPGPASLLVARGGPGGPYARCAGATPARPTGSKALLSQAAQGTSSRDYDTPRVLVTDKLKSYGAAKAQIMPGVEPAAQGAQQPGRSIAPTDPATGTANAAIQIAEPCPTLFVSAWAHQQCLPLSAQLLGSSAVPVRPDCGFFTLE